MKPIRFWEEICANSLPSFGHILYDGWLLRLTHGYARHNNCVWPLYEGEMSLGSKIRYCEQQYALRGSSCGFRLTELPVHKAIEALLTKRGYGRANPNLLMMRASVGGPEVDITEMEMDEWLETIYRIRPGDPNIKEWQRQVYQLLALPSRYVVVKQGDNVCGYGRSVQQDDILNIEGLWMLPDYRGQGLGTQIIHGLLQLGRTDGAAIACVTVNEDNDGARRLYERLGFVNQYLYWYVVPLAEAD